jgi:hypothetical protein
MAYVHIAATRGNTIEDFRTVTAKHNPWQDIDGLLAMAAGSDDSGLHVMTVWASKAHKDRFEAEQLFPAFQAAGIVADVAASTEFTEYETGELYVP